MPASAVFKVLHALVTVALLVVVIGFVWLTGGDAKADDVYQGSHQVSPDLWLYTTKNSSGNATVPIVYRYYLSQQLSGSPDQITKVLHDQMPFLTGTGSISAITRDGDRVAVAYSGRVYSLDPTATYENAGKPVTVQLTYNIQ
ncbi:hypothetical protein ACFSFZ_16090 [Mixta tenebrionis]|uniref:Uncharacterized protein n=1 Tax=Mixta tenebrionis TaxID=2562439 RepID=A0A506V7W5_9GAMM|nr:hypothetical protein [Mixta tenebrionis]TPW41757.1 hypothetical protein FKM52_13475 [Mixta tenebrionis]